ncbi:MULTISPECIES: low molecular weight protein-tyrosine-phosphatase [Paenibacillus]|uniref:low molecular weight protein-tyrosine-phosphatase n=1 Tax=Paenibacillus TaxID=44249 RepID=UPI00129D8C05|nr:MULTISPECIES: low molecular weight protein-tyrosine-phosphatase [Paenibacillus]MBE7680639.1 low molecular weight phosphotyrosine protein phosphatase [Paenibacillus sp. P13VS]MBY0219767.1 low molecular weight phosphotyrosine protein phosphatase [Paenibacillus illinoisensis]MCM3203823.1 low molecular weight phosphotyrosine protein phosphatase [Paenibacillus illinoisensis]WJH28887.1 low molecular weight phosphotyrosine protein phosphatase [Paenibacillus sp. CC-CFT742]
MVRVLFVCLGNICRSPMAEAVLRHKIEERGLQQQIQVDSAGTGDWHIGKPPHEGTRKLLDSYQISYANMAARQFGSADFDQFDYIVCMDDSNVANVRKITGGAEADIMKFMDLLPNESLREVPDPYFTGNFEEVYKLVEAGCNVLLEQIQKDHSLA